MKNLSEKEYVEAPRALQHAYICSRLRIPMDNSRLKELEDGYPEYFTEEIAARKAMHTDKLNFRMKKDTDLEYYYYTYIHRPGMRDFDQLTVTDLIFIRNTSGFQFYKLGQAVDEYILKIKESLLKKKK